MRAGILPVILVGLLSIGMPCVSPAAQSSTTLSQLQFTGSWQGQSGLVMDLNGDGKEDLVVGAPYMKNGKSDGSLLIYSAGRKGNLGSRPSMRLRGEGNLGWSLTPLGPRRFAAAAFNGSGADVSLSGTVTVYNFATAAGTVQKVLSGENALDKFGNVLASGDLNGDGIPDLIVGAPFYSPSAALYQKGAVYVYFGPDYDSTSAIKIPATSSNGGLGFSIAVGDINGDGIDDLLVQATGKVIAWYGSNSFAPAPGAPDVTYTSPNPSTDTDFGKSIAVCNVEGNGFKNVAIGASQATAAGAEMDVIDCGRLYIFGNSAGQPPALLAQLDGEPNSGRFGSSLLQVPDIDGDGVPDLAVGAIHADGNSWLMTGAIFFVSGKTLNLIPEKTIRGEFKDMHLGTFLAQFADGRLVSGAPTFGDNTGAVLIYTLK